MDVKRSESIAALAAALSKAQGEFSVAKFDSTNPFFKSKYASLGSVIEAAKPVMAKYGLSVTQPVIGDGEIIAVDTILMHTSGEWIESVMSLPLTKESGKSQAQAAGSVITYLRRYSLAAILGMYSDDDTDGSDKQEQKPAKKAEQPTPPPQPDANAAPTERPYPPETVKAGLEKKALAHKPFNPSDKQLNLLRHGLELCFTGEPEVEDKRHTLLHYLTGSESTKNVSGQMFKALVEDWLKLKPDTGGAYQVDFMAMREAHNIVDAALVGEGQEQFEL